MKVSIGKETSKLASVGLTSVLLLSMFLWLLPASQANVQDYINQNSTVLTNCDTLKGWSKGSQGTMTSETLIHKEGAGAVKLTSTSTTAMHGEFDIWGNTNMTGRFFKFWLYIDDASKLGRFRFYAFDSNTYKNHAYYEYQLNRLFTG